MGHRSSVLVAGRRVVLEGLVRRTDLNGTAATLLLEVHDGRWLVECRRTGERVNVKTKNLNQTVHAAVGTLLLDLPSQVPALCLSSLSLRGAASARVSCRALSSVEPKMWLTSAFESTWSTRPYCTDTLYRYFADYIAERQWRLQRIVLCGSISAKMLRLLLQASCIDVNGETGTGCTLLWLASAFSPALVDVLLDANADPNLPCDLHSIAHRSNPLHDASENWHESAVHSLLRAHADVHARNGMGMTALELVTQSTEPNGSMTRLRGRPRQAIIDALLHAQQP